MAWSFTVCVCRFRKECAEFLLTSISHILVIAFPFPYNQNNQIQDSKTFVQSSAHFRLQAQCFCPGCLSAAAWFGLILSPQHPLPPRSRPGAGESHGGLRAAGAASDEAKPAAPVEPCAHSDHWSHDANISGSTFVELKEWKLKIGSGFSFIFWVWFGWCWSNTLADVGGCWRFGWWMLAHLALCWTETNCNLYNFIIQYISNRTLTATKTQKNIPLRNCSTETRHYTTWYSQ